MKKILILYGSYGGGHLSAAKTLQTYFQENYQDVNVEIIDCIEYINKHLNKVSTEAYKEFAKKMPWVWKRVYNKSKSGALAFLSTTNNKILSLKLKKLLEEEKPDLVISTHPFATTMCAYLKEKEKVNFKLATILTDYHIHPQWLVLNLYNDVYFVANEQMKMDMISYNIDDDKIFVSGIPISKRFLEPKNKTEIFNSFGLDENKKTLLFFAGGEFGLGRNTTFLLFRTFIRLFPDMQIVAISGKNKNMKAKFEKIIDQTNSSNRVKLLEYTDKVPELMYIATAIVTKPGGLTVSEALASKKPLILINPIPGQEEENAQFLVDNNVAILIKDSDNISRTIKYLFKADKIENMGKSIDILSKPDSTEFICDNVLKLI
ncbi:MAG: glycosyltransferase [Clostridia bacterium]|nr:glycosyltransferase [Clostridia bacterium]